VCSLHVHIYDDNDNPTSDDVASLLAFLTPIARHIASLETFASAMTSSLVQNLLGCLLKHVPPIIMTSLAIWNRHRNETIELDSEMFEQHQIPSKPTLATFFTNINKLSLINVVVGWDRVAYKSLEELYIGFLP
jgi:hypothetical protein